MEQPDKLEFDFDGEIVGLDGDLLPLEGWGAVEHTVLDSLGVGEISTAGQAPVHSGHPPEPSFVDQTTQAAVFPSEHYVATPHLDTASIATTGDTSHMVSVPKAVAATKIQIQLKHVCICMSPIGSPF